MPQMTPATNKIFDAYLRDLNNRRILHHADNGISGNFSIYHEEQFLDSFSVTTTVDGLDSIKKALQRAHGELATIHFAHDESVCLCSELDEKAIFEPYLSQLIEA